jgi:hypothetical protein
MIGTARFQIACIAMLALILSTVPGNGKSQPIMLDIRTGFSESEMHFYETASILACDSFRVAHRTDATEKRYVVTS